MTIRKAVPADIPYLLDIYNYEVENSTATLDIDKKTLPEWEEWYYAHGTDDHPLIVCELEGDAAGYATLSSYRHKQAYCSTVELSVYVSPRFRRRGVGEALMREILSMARDNPALHTVVSVITGGNEASVKLHEKLGFTFCGTIKEVGVKFGRYVDIDNYSLFV